MTSLNAIYSVEIPPTPLDKGGGASRGDPPKALTPTKCVSPKLIAVPTLMAHSRLRMFLANATFSQTVFFSVESNLLPVVPKPS